MANYGHGKKNLYYNIPMFSCLFGSSALLATHADPGEEFVPAKPKDYMSKVAAAITSPATKTTKMKIGKASQSRPARGRPGLLQSLRCCFEAR